MNVAIAISGMPRNLSNSFKWLKEGILDVLEANNYNYHIFVSTWNNNVQKEGDSSVITSGDKPVDFIKIFNPIEIDCEDWNDSVADNLGWQDFKKCQYEIIPRSSALGQFYKIFKCRQLISRREAINKIQYDIIFRIRTEIRYVTKLDIKEVEIAAKADRPLVYLRMGPNPNHLSWTKDTFAFGNRAGMDIYMDCYNHFVDIAKLTKVSTSELVLRNWLYSNKSLQLDHTSLDYILTRN